MTIKTKNMNKKLKITAMIIVPICLIFIGYCFLAPADSYLFRAPINCEFDIKEYSESLEIVKLKNGKYGAMWKYSKTFIEDNMGNEIIYKDSCRLKGHIKWFKGSEDIERVEQTK